LGKLNRAHSSSWSSWSVNPHAFHYLTAHQGMRLQARRRGDARGRSRGQGPRCGRRTCSSPAMVIPSPRRRSRGQGARCGRRTYSSPAMVMPATRGRSRGQGARCGRRRMSPPAMVLPLPPTPVSPSAAAAWHKVRCPSLCLPSYRGVGEWGLQLH